MTKKGKKYENKFETYEQKIIPLLEQVLEICERVGIPALLGFQLAIDDEDKDATISVQSYFPEFTTQQMIVAKKIIRGEATFVDSSSDLTTVINEHIEHCESCKEKVSSLQRAGHWENLTDIEIITHLSQNHILEDKEIGIDEIDGRSFFVPQKSKTIH